MKLIEAYVTWEPLSGRARIIHESETDDIADGWSWLGACRGGGSPLATPHEREMMMFINFHTLVVRDGIPPATAHQAFLAIDEYRWRIAGDVQGAEDRPGSAATSKR